MFLLFASTARLCHFYQVNVNWYHTEVLILHLSRKLTNDDLSNNQLSHYLITNNVEYLFIYLFICTSISVKHLFVASVPNFLLTCLSLWNRFYRVLFVFLMWSFFSYIYCKYLTPVCVQVGHEVSWQGGYVSSKGSSCYLASARCYYGNVDSAWLDLPTKNEKKMNAESLSFYMLSRCSL